MELFSNYGFWHWFWAVYGVLMYNFLAYMYTKDGYDNTRKKFRFPIYFKKRWDNWAWSFLFVPLVVIFGTEIFYYFMQAYEKDWEFNKAIYLLAGPLSELVYFLFRKVSRINKALKSTE